MRFTVWISMILSLLCESRDTPHYKLWHMTLKKIKYNVHISGECLFISFSLCSQILAIFENPFQDTSFRKLSLTSIAFTHITSVWHMLFLLPFLSDWFPCLGMHFSTLGGLLCHAGQHQFLFLFSILTDICGFSGYHFIVKY